MSKIDIKQIEREAKKKFDDDTEGMSEEQIRSYVKMKHKEAMKRISDGKRKIEPLVKELQKKANELRESRK